MIWKVLGVLIIVWLAVTLIGAIVKGLFWLAVIGGLLFVGTAAYAAIKGNNQRSIR
ncbi:hypothetical protein [Rhodococcus sp. X156]|uniref:hypothetical protein n=1 Tax=Rhodococcus sp. X156 TaxID=2499145 RepID=UPI0013E2A9F5|nr:hypothetical protein [Rhodococcus sp. X156]